MIGLGQLDNDLAGWIDRTLVVPGIVPPEHFEEAFVAIVTSSASDPAQAWLDFYRNTLAALRGEPEPGGTNAEIKPVHERAAALAIGDVLELGCCFGFLALRLAEAGHRVIASDLTPGTVELLARTAPQLGLTVETLLADARAVPLPDAAVDTVLAVHLIEHLPPDEGKVVLAEAIRLARRRVVVAVPFEPEPNETWGHLTTFDADALHVLGAGTGLPYEVSEHHGGWLILDTRAPSAAGRPPKTPGQPGLRAARPGEGAPVRGPAQDIGAGQPSSPRTRRPPSAPYRHVIYAFRENHRRSKLCEARSLPRGSALPPPRR